MTTESILEALQVQPLTEEEKQSKHILKRLSGPIASCKEGTRNGRRYNRDLWEQALSDEIFKEKVDTKSLFLELGHPADREETDMTCVCAVIPEMPKIIGDDLYAVVDVIDSPNGKLLSNLIDYGFVPGISSRGSGDVIGDEVDPETFFLETWDIVQTPALKKARLAVNESLQANKMKQALCESLNKASDEDRKVMEEALHNLNINVEETNEVSNPNVEENINSESTKQTKDETKEANYAGSEELIKSLQEALSAKAELECKVKELQEALAVSDTKVSKLDEELTKDKNMIVRLSTLAKNSRDMAKKVSTLEEELKVKNQTIDELTKEKEDVEDVKIKTDSKLTESLKTKDATIKELNESLNTLKEEHEKEVSTLKESLESKLNDSTKLVEELTEKVTKSEKISEGYKKLANSAISKYIDLKAKNYGLEVEDIMNKLGAKYTLNDVDRVCESLQNYNLGMSKLPFKVDRQVKVQIKSKEQGSKDIIDDDYVDDTLMSSAGLI